MYTRLNAGTGRNGTMLSYETFHPSKLTALIRFWNETFSGFRHFDPIDAPRFRKRIVEQEAFDPDGLIIAAHGDQVIGMVHAMRPAPHSYFVYRENKCAENGSIALLGVRMDHRRRGVGSELLRRAEDYLKVHIGGKGSIFAGDFWVPLYHTLEGPRQPFWGDTEMIGISKKNTGFVSFLRMHGYRQMNGEGEEITMVSDTVPRADPHKPPLQEYGLREIMLDRERVWDGKIDWYPDDERGYGYERFGPYLRDAIVLVRGDTVTSHLEWYPMREEGRVALWDLMVGESDRGKGLGSYLLDRSLFIMQGQGYRIVELHSNTLRNARAVAMYRQRGFQIVERWMGFRKMISG
jgi:ribosomal protein S18 acetylase RimI-like enzyme